MRLLKGFRPIRELIGGAVATIGNFDGVHKGHQALLSTLRMEADRRQLPLMIVLFEPQPGEFFHEEKAPARLSSLREKLDVLRCCKVDFVYRLKFDHKLSTMSPEEFAERILFSTLHIKYLLIGADFRFGSQRLGDVNTLSQLAANRDCEVAIFPDFVISQEKVSSTKIRHALQIGNLEQAAECLGRRYSLCGRVVRGKGLGRQWGIPTANVSVHRINLPLKGVFGVQVQRQGGALLFGVANLGTRPTVDGSKPILEIHLFDFDDSLYGEMIQAVFMYKLRDEIKFSSTDALIKQIHNDINTAKERRLPVQRCT